MPQGHDATAITKAGFDEWSGFISRRLDWERMEIAPEDRSQVLQKIFNNISGVKGEIDPAEWKKLIKGKGRIFADKNSESRFMHFKTADSWLDYQSKFGSKDIFGTILKHVRDMSDDIALIETLGPDPDAAFSRLAKYVDGKYGQAGRVMSAPAQRMYDVFRHKAGIENIKAAKAMSAVRTFSATSRAGKIVISALTDMPIATMRALYSGLGASGLIRWTEGMKLGFAMEFSHALGQTAYKGWKQLNQPMRNTMERYGIGKKEWNLVRLKVRQDKASCTSTRRRSPTGTFSRRSLPCFGRRPGRQSLSQASERRPSSSSCPREPQPGRSSDRSECSKASR